MKRLTVAVLGHVDHGKTSLVKALTGTDTDTLPDEKQRGLTISLGFAYFVTSAGIINFIDAPGHVDFINTTVSALSGVDTVLLVISAADGIQAQTREHLEIVEMMDIQHLMIAITKTDRAENDAIATLIQQVTDMLASQSFVSSEIVTCTTQTATGLDAIKLGLNKLATLTREHKSLPGFYLPIDRAFSMTGSGTIVTGTLLGQTVQRGQSAMLQPTETVVTVRAIQVNGTDVENAEPGTRVAINLRGVSVDEISKGYNLCSVGTFPSSMRFDVVLDMQAASAALPRHMETVTVLYGTHHASAKVRYLDRANLNDKKHIYAQLEFVKPQTAYAGQRLVIRRPATAHIAAGGAVLDPNASALKYSKFDHIRVLETALNGDPLDIAQALAKRGSGVALMADIERLSRRDTLQVKTAIQTQFDFNHEGFAFERTILHKTKGQILENLKQHHQHYPLRPLILIDQIVQMMRATNPTLFNHAKLRLKEEGSIVVNANRIADAGFNPYAALSEKHLTLLENIEDALKVAGINALRQDIHENDADLTDLYEILIHKGDVIRLHNHALKQSLLIHKLTVESARKTLQSAFPKQATFTTSDARKALATNRKVIVPLLEYFDQNNVSVRNGNLRYLSDTSAGVENS